jgi:2-polyprenyl-3-methyl-5-hydroxy-6-metoxy-1,4-benzoquinol methylase
MRPSAPPGTFLAEVERGNAVMDGHGHERGRWSAEPGAGWATLGDVRERLRSGARVADLRCGRGRALIDLALTYPASTFHGFDDRPALVEAARTAAAEAGVSDRVTFEVAPPAEVPGDGYDPISLSDLLEDPETFSRTARRVSEVLAAGGAWVVRRTGG